MAGYESLANTFLNEWNFFPSGMPFETTEHDHSITKYEYFPPDGGNEVIQVANPMGGLKILVEFSP